MVKLLVVGAAVFTILLGCLSGISLGSNAIDPRGNPVPENPVPVGGGAPGPSNSAPPATVTLRTILTPSVVSVVNDTHCDNNVNDNDNITVPINPSSPPAPLSSSTTASPAPVQSSSLAPTVNLSSSPAPVSSGVTEAVTQANSSPLVSSTTPGISILPITSTQRPREGKNIAQSSTSSNATAELPRGYYLPPKNA